MSGQLTISSSLASLKALRQLSQTTQNLGQVYKRLSSGLRINSPSDDAAGLSVASALTLDARVYSQGIRNLNDGISALHIANGAVSELNAILFRVKELAEQSANGTLNTQQRRPLDSEANALINEFNRIISTTEYNSRVLFDGSATGVELQAGYGASGSLAIDIGSGIKRNVADITGSSTIGLYTTGTGPAQVASGDLNGDGFADIVTSDYNAAAGTTLSVLLGNGDGSFKAKTAYATDAGPYGLQMKDVNNDGRLDVVVSTTGGSNSVNVLLGVGDGTLQAAVPYLAPAFQAAVADFNGDDMPDLVGIGGGNAIMVSMNNGNGTFRFPTVGTIGAASGSILEAADFNNDGFNDLVAIHPGNTTAQIFLGNGNGSFRAPTLLTTDTTPVDTTTGDINHDGTIDLVISNMTAGNVQVFRGNGDGTFKAPTIIGGLANVRNVELVDMNDDGKLDLYATTLGGNIGAYLGHDDGTFSGGSVVIGGAALGFAIADYNGDGALDAAIADVAGGRVMVAISSTSSTSTMANVNLMSTQTALASFQVIDKAMRRVSSEIGRLGAAESRVESALAVLGQTRENYQSAASQIMDADVAQESSALIRTRILQQAGVAVLAQANNQPQIALQLLQGKTSR